MKCYRHIDSDIVVQCSDCSKGLCSDCSNRFSAILCEDCLLKNNSLAKSSALRSLITAAILFILVFIWTMGSGMNFLSSIIVSYIFAGIPIGWKAISKITPDIFLLLPIIGWVIYFVYKLFFSGIIGIVMTPFHLNKMLKEIKIANLTQQQLNSGEI